MAKCLQWMYFFSTFCCGILAQTANRTCGIPAIPPNSGQSRVKGGEEAMVGSWPWQVRLGYRNGNGIIWTCGGSILTEIYIITAAHCLDGNNRQYVVRVGDHDQSRPDASEVQHTVLRHRVHPSYGGPSSNYANDVAILRLATPITFKPQVSPVCIPPAMEEPAHGASCYVTGWGRLSPASSEPAKLQQGRVQIIQRSVCNSAPYWGGVLRTSQVCAGSPTGTTDACKGDSGGPLVCRAGGSNRWILQGLVSFGPLSGCGTQKQPAVYTKVSHFHAWIRDTTGTVVGTG